mgnify:CR=1 FL=1
MFTGIIQGLGQIIDNTDGIFKIETKLNLENCNNGSSISCNGVCLTLIDIKKHNDQYIFSVNIGEETMNRTIYKNRIQSNKINLEKSLTIGDEIGGHFVYGHIDCVTKITKILNLNNSWEFNFEKKFNNNNLLVVEKGSISINGISLTIAKVEKEYFTISIIPHTFNNTNLKFAEENDLVNVEFDYLARYLLNKNEK